MNKEKKLKHLSNIVSGIFLKSLDLVNIEEFEEIKSMIIKAREENLILEAKIKTLEKKVINHKKH